MGWVVNAKSRPLYIQERPNCIVGLVGLRAGLDNCGKSRPPGIRSLDCSARSQSLYRQSYTGPQHVHVGVT